MLETPTIEKINLNNLNMMKNALLICMVLFVQTSYAQNACSSFGWVNYDGQSQKGAVTGGGNATPIKVTTFSELKSALESSGAKVIWVMNDVGNGYKGKSGDVLNVKSDKTVVGFKPGITVKCSWQIKGASNVIVKNLICRGPGNSNSEQNWDAVNIENSKRIWFDHCTVMEGEDGNFDVVKGSDNVTVTWCKFYYVTGGGHNLSNLVGSSDNEPQSHGKLNITYAYCWWDNVNSRTPRTRYGKIHVLNCYYNKCGQGPHSGFMSNIRMEGCFLESNVSSPTGQTSPGAGSGIFVIDCNRGSTIKTGNIQTVFTPPYTYNKWPNGEVKGKVTNPNCGAGPTLKSPTDCGCDAITALEEEVNKEMVISIYPNPSQSNFQVNLKSISNLQLFDAEGKLWEEHQNVQNVIIGDRLIPGLYFLKIGNAIHKLIKE
jgi:pectate lyase